MPMIIVIFRSSLRFGGYVLFQPAWAEGTGSGDFNFPVTFIIISMDFDIGLSVLVARDIGKGYLLQVDRLDNHGIC